MTYFLRRSKLSTYNSQPTKHRSWALITGASDGIGFGFATELLAHDFNVILHGRNASKLYHAASALSTEFPSCQIRTIVADADTFTESTITSIVEQLKDVPLRVLINNVGGTASAHADFLPLTAHSFDEVDALLNINVRFTTQLTRSLLPLLAVHEPALVLNISSLAANGFPFMSVYSGCKGFITTFSHSLSLEMRGLGRRIEVLGILVGSVQSQQNRAETSFFVPSSRDMARAALARVGCGRAVVFGYWTHALQWVGISLLPQFVYDQILISTMKDLSQKPRGEY